jgi:hypothetical protein
VDDAISSLLTFLAMIRFFLCVNEDVLGTVFSTSCDADSGNGVSGDFRFRVFPGVAVAFIVEEVIVLDSSF